MDGDSQSLTRALGLLRLAAAVLVGVAGAQLAGRALDMLTASLAVQAAAWLLGSAALLWLATRGISRAIARLCPFCFNEIHEKASTCPACGEQIPAGPCTGG